VALSVELEEIKKVNKFSTAFGEQAIEAVIQGDWRELEEVANFLTFSTENPEIRDQFSPLWDKFRTLALTACAEEKRRVPGQGSEAH
jgi:urease accessory protein UreF